MISTPFALNMRLSWHLVFLVLLETALFMVCDTADTQSMRENIVNHFSKSRHHATNNLYKLEARKFVFDEFTRFGLETHYQFFTDARYPNVTFANIIGILKGERFGKLNDRILGVEAHYDTVNVSSGVDDNGAGVAAMLEVVRQVTDANKQGTKRQNTLFFASFDAEELDYIGGCAFTNYWLGPYLESNYGQDAGAHLLPRGVIVMDTMMNYDPNPNSQVIPKDHLSLFQQYFPQASSSIAKDNYEGDFLLLTYRLRTQDDPLANNFIKAWNSLGQAQFEIEPFPLPRADPEELRHVPALRNFLRSDHVALWFYNIPAIFISDSANFRGDMIQCYHHACDNLTTMLTDDNIRFLGKTADAITSTLNTLSETGSVSEAPKKCGVSLPLLATLILIIPWG